MKQFKQAALLLISAATFTILISCGSEPNPRVSLPDDAKELTIFFTNDMHSQLDNFAKIKHIVDAEREVTNVLLVSAGDVFSGSPIVDQYEERGFPIIDIMNQTGYDVSVIGNHEFDYGLETLNDRIQQANFDWVCANVDASESLLDQPDAFTSIEVGDLTVTILGLVETNGKENDIIPSTHPWRVMDLTFQRYETVLPQYENLKTEEEADLLIALTHLGSFADFFIADVFPYFDVIIGGHTNDLNDEIINGTPVLMAGRNLSHLGKIELTVSQGRIISQEITLINLANYDEQDEALAAAIEEYNDEPKFAEVIGFAESFHGRNELGCFYTTALKEFMGVDASFQNSGGIRANIAEGEITVLDIYNMDPFNNGSVVFTMTAAELKDFFIESGAGLHVSGITFEKEEQDLLIFDEDGEEIRNDEIITIGINDYIPAVHDDYFSFDDAEVRELTTAESIIEYLKTMNSTVDYEGCNSFFAY